MQIEQLHSLTSRYAAYGAGPVEAGNRALATISGQMQTQAALLSYLDIFVVLLLGCLMAAGLTPLRLKDSITEKLKKYIADPRVTVIVTAMNSQRVFITGEVQRSGPIQLLPNMTILQALSQAGFTEFANLKSIYLLRTQNGRQVKVPFNYKEVVKGNHLEQNISLKAGDVLVVP